MALKANTNQVEYASPDEASHAYLVRGITLNAVPGAGNALKVQTLGDLTDSTWNLIPGKVIYLGANGTMSQVYDPTRAYTLILGVAVTATSILLKIQNPIFLI